MSWRYQKLEKVLNLLSLNCENIDDAPKKFHKKRGTQQEEDECPCMFIYIVEIQDEIKIIVNSQKLRKVVYVHYTCIEISNMHSISSISQSGHGCNR